MNGPRPHTRSRTMLPFEMLVSLTGDLSRKARSPFPRPRSSHRAWQPWREVGISRSWARWTSKSRSNMVEHACAATRECRYL